MLIFALSTLLAIAIPLSLIRLWTRRSMSWRVFFSAFGIGAAGWLVAKVPKGVVVLTFFHLRGIPLHLTEAQLESLLRTNLSLLIISAICAGVFEEIFKPAGLLVVRGIPTSANASHVGWVVGIGAGIIEAVNVVGGSWLKVGLGMSSYAEITNVPLERALVIVFHGALTAMFVRAVAHGRRVLAIIPIALHVLADFVVPWLQLTKGFTPWTADAALSIFVITAVCIERSMHSKPAQISKGT